MRTLKNILEDYLTFSFGQDISLEVFLSGRDDHDKTIEQGKIYTELIKRCMDKDIGLFYFTKFILGDMLYAGYPKPIRYNSLFRKFDAIFKSHKHVSVQCARTHGKSTFSYIYILYLASLFKDQLIILESASDKQAVKHLKKIKRIIESNEFLSTKVQKNAQNTNNHIDFNGGYIEAYGFGSEIRGDHVDLIIVDDILRSDNKLSDQQIEDFMFEELEPMIGDRRGQIVLIGTRKHEEDVFGKLNESRAWKSINFPAILDWEKKILQCPDRYTWEDLMYKMAIQGRRSFLKEYQNEFYSGAMSVFNYEDIKLAKDKGKNMVLQDSGHADKQYYAGVDTARAGTHSADFTVMFVLELNPVKNTKKIVHMWRDKGRKISYQVNKIANIAKRFNNCTVLVEKNNMGQEFIDQLVDDHNLDIESFTTTSTGTGKKEDLIRLLINVFENEKMIIPQGDYESRVKMDTVINELNKFQAVKTKAGNEQLKGVGSKDDCVMALAMANKATLIGHATPMAVVKEKKSSGTKSELEELIELGLI